MLVTGEADEVVISKMYSTYINVIYLADCLDVYKKVHSLDCHIDASVERHYNILPLIPRGLFLKDTQAKFLVFDEEVSAQRAPLTSNRSPPCQN